MGKDEDIFKKLEDTFKDLPDDKRNEGIARLKELRELIQSDDIIELSDDGISDVEVYIKQLESLRLNGKQGFAIIGPHRLGLYTDSENKKKIQSEYHLTSGFTIDEYYDVKQREEKMSHVVQLFDDGISDVEAYIKRLESLRLNGKQGFVIFGPHRLGLYTDSEVKQMVQSEYHLTSGFTIDEYYKTVDKMSSHSVKDPREDWIMRGQMLIYPQRYAEWKKHVDISIDFGNYLDIELEIMQFLNDGNPVIEAVKLLDTLVGGPFEKAKKSIIGTILRFSKRGPEFFMATEYGKKVRLNSNIQNSISIIEQENAEYEASSSSKNTK